MVDRDASQVRDSSLESSDMVGRVARVVYESIFADEWVGGHGVEAAQYRQAAQAALEASHHAELVGVLYELVYRGGGHVWTRARELLAKIEGGQWNWFINRVESADEASIAALKKQSAELVEELRIVSHALDRALHETGREHDDASWWKWGAAAWKRSQTFLAKIGGGSRTVQVRELDGEGEERWRTETRQADGGQ